MIKTKKRRLGSSHSIDEKKMKMKVTSETGVDNQSSTIDKKSGGVVKKLKDVKKKSAKENGQFKSTMKKKGFTKKFVAGNKEISNNKFAQKNQDEKTDWTKFKQRKKELKLKRKQTKDTYKLSVDAKKIYENLKCRRTKDKHELVKKLYDLFKAPETFRKVVMAHDTGRIVQCMLKYAKPSLREDISEKLLPYSVQMCTSKYSHFCVLRLLKYGSSSIKSKLVDSFQGHVVKLASHNISSKILDHVYMTIASCKQKAFMRQELYSDLYKNSKDDSVMELCDAYRDASNMKTSILSAVKANLEHVFNKNLADNSLIHAVTLEYLHSCDEDKMEEIVSICVPVIAHLLSTKDGSQAAIICFYKSSTRDRRAILKGIKTHLVKICTHEHGHVFLIALINSLDDTKATKKSIYDNIHAELRVLMENQWGRRVVEWLVSPADTKFFHPSFIAKMDEGLQHGKKDRDIRRKEIFEQIEELLTNSITEYPDFWLSDCSTALVTAAILGKVNGKNYENASTALARIVCKPSWRIMQKTDAPNQSGAKNPVDIEQIITEARANRKRKNIEGLKLSGNDATSGIDKINVDTAKVVEKPGSETDVLGIEDAGLHFVLKKIIKSDFDRQSQSSEEQTCITFGSKIVEMLTADTVKVWLSANRGCFVLIAIIENNNSDTLEKLKLVIEPHLKLLKQQATPGAKLLLEKLAF